MSDTVIRTIVGATPAAGIVTGSLPTHPAPVPLTTPRPEPHVVSSPGGMPQPETEAPPTPRY